VSLDPVIAVNRFGLGAAPGELAAVGGDPRGWLAAQLKGPAPRSMQLEALAPSEQALKEFPRWVAQLRRNRRAMQEGDASMAKGVEEKFRDHFLPILAKETGARLDWAATTSAPLRERLVWFWANHFTVSSAKPVVFAVAGCFEREAIRPHVAGRFEDMLLASTRHPAMILYLDNQLSVRAGWSPPERFRRAGLPAPSGLNENLAREVLELHTLGVQGGYTQADVTEFARVLTGWSVGRPLAPGFRFAADRHEPGSRTILGKRYAEDGMAQGEAVLRDLAAHPATATHVAAKLCRHFIADAPPPAAVGRVASAFRDSGGDLPSVHSALLECPEAWSAPLPKLKTPTEFLVACLRALPEARGAEPGALLFALHEMGQRPFAAPSPQGWPDTAEAWAGSDGLWKRIEWAGILASRLGSRVDPLGLVRDTYGEAANEPTQLAVSRAESREQALALWLSSPEFQRR